MSVVLLPLGLVLGGLLLLAFSHTSQVFTGSQSQSEQGGLVGWLKTITHASIGGLIVSAAAKAIRSTVSHYAVSHLKPLARWLWGINAVVRSQARTTTHLAEQTAQAFETTHAELGTKATKAGVRNLGHRVSGAEQTAKVAKANAHTAHTALDHYKVRTNTRLNHLTHATTATIPGEIGKIRAKEHGQDQALTDLRGFAKSVENGAIRTFEWLRSHPYSAAMGVFTGAVAVALSKLGFPFFRCRAWQNVGRKITCGMGSLLNDLLAAGVDVLLVSDICEIVNLTTLAAKQFEPALVRVVDTADALIGCHGATAPAALPVHGVPLAPITATVTL